MNEPIQYPATLYRYNEKIMAYSRNKKFTLKELQYYVEGYIEILDLNSKYCLIVNEDAIPLNMPLNIEASKIFKRKLYGPVLHVRNNLI